MSRFQMKEKPKSEDTSTVQGRVVSPRRAVRDGELDEEDDEDQENNFRVTIDRSNVGKNKNKVTLRSKQSRGRQFRRGSSDSSSSSDGNGNAYDSVASSQDNIGSRGRTNEVSRIAQTGSKRRFYCKRY